MCPFYFPKSRPYDSGALGDSFLLLLNYTPMKVLNECKSLFF